jgi:hypothetical protein
MSERTKEYGHSLLQRDPNREQMLAKMRGKLATTSATAAAAAVAAAQSGPMAAPRKVRRGQGWTWAMRVTMVALIAAINWLLIERKDTILASVGLQGIPSLPKAGITLSVDEKALYYTYAMFDYRKFQARFGTGEYYAVDPNDAHRRLEDLLPKVSPAVLGEISGYTPVAFKSVSAGGRR